MNTTRFVASVLVVVASTAGYGQIQSSRDLDLLDLATEGLRSNAWLDRVQLQGEFVISSTFKDTLEQPRVGSFIDFDNTSVTVDLKRDGTRFFVHETYTLGESPVSTYQVRDDEKVVLYDDTDVMYFTATPNYREYFFQVFGMADIESNSDVGGFLDALEYYRAAVEAGTYRLEMQDSQDAWRARFTSAKDPQSFATLVFDPEKNFNIVQIEYNNSYSKVGSRRTELQYVDQAGHWVPSVAHMDESNSNMDLTYDFSVKEISVADDAQFSSEDFDFREIPIKATRIIDERFDEPMEYVYGDNNDAVTARLIAELAQTPLDPGQKALIDRQGVVTRGDAPKQLPQLDLQPVSDTPHRRKPWGMLMGVGALFFLLAFVIGVRTVLRLFLFVPAAVIAATASATPSVQSLLNARMLVDQNSACGANCAATVLALGQEPFDYSTLARLLIDPNRGSSMLGMQQFFERRNWAAKPIQAQFSQMLQVLDANPSAYAIVHLATGRHWVVVRSSGSNRYEVVDYPAKLSMSQDHLSAKSDRTVSALIVSPRRLPPFILDRAEVFESFFSFSLVATFAIVLGSFSGRAAKRALKRD